ncbi:MAG: NADH-quinone oxidoreductase subunit H [Nitrospirae bacterium]|nr:MAG: NADH-quinone oxidoreductase subunit H [Nitrospirota bacterium]
MWIDLAIKAGCAVFMMLVVVNIAGIHSWVERKQSAVIQDRWGANRTGFTIHNPLFRWLNPILRPFIYLGLFQPIADLMKLVAKEDWSPVGGMKWLHQAAPVLYMIFATVGFAAIPFGDVLHVAGHDINLQVANLNVGFVFIFAMAGLGVYGIVLSGVASNNNYAFLGAMRAASQMISYEVTLGATIIGIVMIYGSLDLQEIVRGQGALLWGWLPKWGVFVQPLGFILFLTAAVAETKRIPFDLPEGESEIIGYFTEYSGTKFGIFLLSDFIETVMVAALCTTLFFGGWQFPYLQASGFVFPWGATVPLGHYWVVLIQVLSFLVKVIAFCWLLMTVRWTLPRFRYDQLMALGWKRMLPVSLANIAVTGLVMLLI